MGMPEYSGKRELWMDVDVWIIGNNFSQRRAKTNRFVISNLRNLWMKNTI